MSIRANFLTILLFVLLSGCSSDDSVSPDNSDGVVERVEVEVVTVVGADEYINHRFFRLEVPGFKSHGNDKLPPGNRVELSSIKVFQLMAPGQFGPDDIMNVAAYIADNGSLGWTGIDFSQPRIYGTRWRRIASFEPGLNAEGGFEYIDLRESLGPDDVLAVTYDIIDSTGNVLSTVGDDPSLVPATQPDVWESGQDLYYRMKLLKAPDSGLDEYTSSLVMRNIYSLGGSYIDQSNFELRIEALNQFPDLDLAAEGVPWVRLFGLDIEDQQGNPGHDGIIDFHNPLIFDLRLGLLRFPLDNPHPFAAAEYHYLQDVSPDEYPWDGSYLEQNLVPEIYQFDTPPENLIRYRKFQIVSTYKAFRYISEPLGAVSLNRQDWFWASAPVPHLDADYLVATYDNRTFGPEDRVPVLRWFAPRERTLRRYLNPSLTGSAADETQPTLDLYLRTEEDPWHSENWGGITIGLDRIGLDANGLQKIELWVNDHQPDPSLRSGRLHVDFGFINEDGFWPQTADGLQYGTYQYEDANGDGVWVFEEDIGLDGLDEFGPDRFDPSYEINGDQPYPQINGTARNAREDDEDLNGNTRMDTENGYFTNAIDLKETEPDVDVVRDYADVGDLIAEDIAWRKYSLLLGHSMPIAAEVEPNAQRITHLRIWYENDAPGAPNEVHVQLSGLRFVK